VRGPRPWPNWHMRKFVNDLDKRDCHPSNLALAPESHSHFKFMHLILSSGDAHLALACVRYRLGVKHFELKVFIVFNWNASLVYRTQKIYFKKFSASHFSPPGTCR